MTSIHWRAVDGASVVLVVPNIDDDNNNGTPDFEDPVAENDDDRGVLEVVITENTQLTFEGDASKIRVLRNGELLIGGETREAELTLSDGELLLEVEVAASGPIGTLTVGESSLEVRGVAPTMGHHLLPTERVWVVRVPPEPAEQVEGNLAMVEAMQRVLGDRLVVVDSEQFPTDPEGYSSLDIWFQDEHEAFGLWTPDAQSQLIMNSPRDGGLDMIVKNLRGPGIGRIDLAPTDPEIGAPSQDYGGNIEVSPPVSVNGTDYPLGRIYYGVAEAEEGPSEVVRTFLHGTGMQSPFSLDVSWLCVGHIDEVLTFLPDKNAPRGFRMYVADTSVGLRMLQSMDASLTLPRYQRTASNVAEDAALLSFNERVQREKIEPTIEIMRRELALTDEEIVRVPAFFHVGEYATTDDCAEAFIPGTVNLLMVTNENGDGGTAIIPDPFLRGEGQTQDVDPLVRFWQENTSSDVEVVFVDDWQLYHLGGGEVHCGTNQTRTPAMSRLQSIEPWLTPSEDNE